LVGLFSQETFPDDFREAYWLLVHPKRSAGGIQFAVLASLAGQPLRQAQGRRGSSPGMSS